MSETTKTTTQQSVSVQQINKLRNFGKKNGVSQDVVEKQVPYISQTEEVEKSPVIKKQEVVVEKIKEQPVGNTTKERPSSLKKQSDTYFRYAEDGKDGGGVLEIDLITFREKGVETRYLSLSCMGYDIRKDPPTQQESFLSINSKKEFERIKEFFSQLEWEN